MIEQLLSSAQRSNSRLGARVPPRQGNFEDVRDISHSGRARRISKASPRRGGGGLTWPEASTSEGGGEGKRGGGGVFGWLSWLARNRGPSTTGSKLYSATQPRRHRAAPRRSHLPRRSPRRRRPMTGPPAPAPTPRGSSRPPTPYARHAPSPAAHRRPAKRRLARGSGRSPATGSKAKSMGNWFKVGRLLLEQEEASPGLARRARRYTLPAALVDGAAVGIHPTSERLDCEQTQFGWPGAARPPRPVSLAARAPTPVRLHADPHVPLSPRLDSPRRLAHLSPRPRPRRSMLHYDCRALSQFSYLVDNLNGSRQ
ncbi:Protein of unknown function [Gryllus bimaculatus]|nr:Protein of unknown function [Gryllus bimaculatus]